MTSVPKNKNKPRRRGNAGGGPSARHPNPPTHSVRPEISRSGPIHPIPLDSRLPNPKIPTTSSNMVANASQPVADLTTNVIFQIQGFLAKSLDEQFHNFSEYTVTKLENQGRVLHKQLMESERLRGEEKGRWEAERRELMRQLVNEKAIPNTSSGDLVGPEADGAERRNWDSERSQILKLLEHTQIAMDADRRKFLTVSEGLKGDLDAERTKSANLGKNFKQQRKIWRTEKAFLEERLTKFQLFAKQIQDDGREDSESSKEFEGDGDCPSDEELSTLTRKRQQYVSESEEDSAMDKKRKIENDIELETREHVVPNLNFESDAFFHH